MSSLSLEERKHIRNVFTKILSVDYIWKCLQTFTLEFFSSCLFSKHMKIKIYSTIILPVFLHGCAILSLVLKAFKSSVLKEYLSLRGRH